MDIYEIAEELRTQDNRITSHPIFQVKETRDSGEDDVVASYFTNKGAEKFIEMQGGEFNDPYIYVASGYRNEEHIVIRDFLMGLESKGKTSND